MHASSRNILVANSILAIKAWLALTYLRMRTSDWQGFCDMPRVLHSVLDYCCTCIKWHHNRLSSSPLTWQRERGLPPWLHRRSSLTPAPLQQHYSSSVSISSPHFLGVEMPQASGCRVWSARVSYNSGTPAAVSFGSRRLKDSLRLKGFPCSSWLGMLSYQNGHLQLPFPLTSIPRVEVVRWQFPSKGTFSDLFSRAVTSMLKDSGKLASKYMTRSSSKPCHLPMGALRIVRSFLWYASARTLHPGVTRSRAFTQLQ